ncbi:MAG: rRNA pseudouridine synthase [Sphingobacteriales bacterium]|nr:MAG: rRNA pseudouridine synthase [Sphingobacteriales bacterium]
MPFNNKGNSRDDKSKKDGSKFGKTDSNRTFTSGSRSSDKPKSSSRPYGTYTPGGNSGSDNEDKRNQTDNKKTYNKDRSFTDNSSSDRFKKTSYGGKSFGKDSRSTSGHSRNPNTDSRERKPYGDKPEGGYNRERKPFGDKPEGGFNRERKPFGERTEGGYNRERKPFGDKPEGLFNRERKPFGERTENSGSRERKPFNPDRNFNKDEKKPFGDKPREAKSFSNKKFTDREKTPFKGRVKAEEDDLRPSYTSKAENFSRPYEKTYEKRGSQPNQDVIDFGDGNIKPRGKVGSKSTFNKDEDFIRLNRYIANAGICSRRKADELIAAGVVSVNGIAITELGAKVNPAKDEIRYNGELLKSEKMVYVLLNKPKDFITTTDDPQERKTVMALVDKASRERIYPVGRLDRNTTGLLLMTNDGDLAEKLSHPRNNISKIYQVELSRNLSQGDFNKISFGLELEDGFIKPDTVSYVTGGSKNEIGIQIHSGKNRIVRRIFESLGYEVVKLDRVIYANLSKKDLPRGKWRHLNEKEVIQLKHFIK